MRIVVNSALGFAVHAIPIDEKAARNVPLINTEKERLTFFRPMLKAMLK